MRTQQVPRGARHLRTYAEFRSYLVDFVEGRYPFLWVVGRPGLAKTESVRSAVGGREVYYRKGGQLTPLQFFVDCYRHRGQPFILDDGEHLLDNKIGAKLISALGDTGRAKLLCYGTTARLPEETPTQFYTSSPLCIISNRFADDEALMSRPVTLHFDPPNSEIHRAVAEWFWDQEIRDWFGRHLDRLGPLDARWYVHADHDKRAERDWQQIALRAYAHDRAACVVQDLEGDPAYPTREDRARRFLELMGAARGASRPTYFRLLGRLQKQGRLAVDIMPPITLRRTRSPGAPTLLELQSMGAAPPTRPEEDPRPLDLPAREAFQQPVRGDAAPPTPPQRPRLDDSLPWEVRNEQDDDEEA